MRLYNNHNTFRLTFIFLVLILFCSCTEKSPTNISPAKEGSLLFQSGTQSITIRAITKLSAFETTLYPLLNQYCVKCHGSIGSVKPSFSNDVYIVLAEINLYELANFSIPYYLKISYQT